MEITTVDQSTIGILTKAEIDQQIATAKAYPRDIKKLMSNLKMMVTLDEDTAEDCIYALPRGGKMIEGPSARFAETAAHCYGNCRAGARIVNEEREFVTAQGVFHDLETNTAITYEVKRRIVDKNGSRYNADMIGVTGNAASSIALRNAILKGIPHQLWKAAYQDARGVAMGDEKTTGTKRAGVVAYFGKRGVTPEQICAALKIKSVEEIGPEQLLTLRGIATAIKDGDTTAEQAFGGEVEPGMSEDTEEVNAKLAEEAAKRKSAEKSQSNAAPQQEPFGPPDGAVGIDAGDVAINDAKKPPPAAPAAAPAEKQGKPAIAKVTFNMLSKRILMAVRDDEFTEIEMLAMDHLKGMERTALLSACKDRRKELTGGDDRPFE